MSKVTRRECREVLFQCLYARIFQPQLDIRSFVEAFFSSPRYLHILEDRYFNEMFAGVASQSSSLSRVVSHYARKFDISLIAPIHLLPLYIALYEMLYLSVDFGIEHKISVNEGILLSKIFCDESNKRLTNGVLHSVLLAPEEAKSIAQGTGGSVRDIFHEESRSFSHPSTPLSQSFLSPSEIQIERAKKRKFEIDALSITQNPRKNPQDS